MSIWDEAEKELRVPSVWDEVEAELELPAEKPIGIGEAIKRADIVDVLEKIPVPFNPYRGAEKAGYFQAKNRLIENKYEKYAQAKYEMTPMGGYTMVRPAITKEQDLTYTQQFENWETEVAQRGYTKPAAIAHGVIEVLPWVADIAISASPRQAMSEVISKTITNKSLAKGISLLTNAAIATSLQPGRIQETLSDVALQYPKLGKEKVYTKAMSRLYIENLSEMLGGYITKGIKIGGTKALNKMPFGKKILTALAKASKRFEGKVNINTLEKISTVTGINNLFGEFSEERVNTILQGLVNADDFGAGPEAGAFERIAAGLKRDIANLDIEIPVLTLPVGARYAIGIGAMRGLVAPVMEEVAPEEIVEFEEPSSEVMLMKTTDIFSELNKRYTTEQMEIGYKEWIKTPEGRLEASLGREGLVKEAVRMEIFAKLLLSNKPKALAAMEKALVSPIAEEDIPVKPTTAEQVIGEKYGITPEETERRLAEAETQYRELKRKPAAERSKAEREELAFLRRNRKDIEAILGRETAPPIPKPRSRRDLLALGHVIPRELGMTEEERRDWIEAAVPGKRSLGKLTKAELLTVVEELESLTGKRVELKEEDYDKPIQVGGRTTSMRNVLRESAVTVEELPEQVKIPERVRKRFIRKQRGGIGRATQQFLWGIDNSPLFHLASILSGGKRSTITDILDTNIQQGRKGEVGHKRAVYDTIKQLNEDSGITDEDLARMSKGLNPRFQVVQALQEQLDVGTEIMTEEINGREFDLTYANLIDIFLMAQQEDGLRHIHGGGLVINGVETGAISEDTLEHLIRMLETNPKAMRITDIFVKEIGEKIWKPSINRISLEMDGKEIATVENWWGLEVAYPAKVPGKEAAYRKFNINLIEDRRIFKDRTKSIRPLIVRDAFDRFTMFENAIAEYTNMAQPARYARTLINQPDIAAALERKGYSNIRDNVVALLEQAQSVPAQQGAFGKFLSKLKIIPGVYRAVLFFNPRVWLSQYTSTANYAAFVSPKYMSLFTKGMTPDAIERVLEMSPIAWDRFYMGHSSLELGELGAADATLRAFTKTTSDKNKLGITLRMSDIAAIATGNEIAIAEYDDAQAGKIIGDSADWWAGKDTSFKKESTDWQRAVTDRAEWLWQRSQPSWDKWNRSMITGDPSAIKRIFFLFRSFHEKSLTILQQANLEYNNSARTATDRMKQAKKYGAVLSGYTINTILRAAVAAVLYRKIKEPFQYLSDIITAPFSMLPILGKILQNSIRNFVNVLARHKTEYRGEAIESLPVKVINTIASAPDNFTQAAAYYLMGEKEKARRSLKRAIGKVYEGVGIAEGVPVYEIKKFYKGWIEEEEPSGAPRRRPPRR